MYICKKRILFFKQIMKPLIQYNNMKKITIAVLLTFSLHNFSQNKNEFYIQLGYSQASQSPTTFNLFQTSFWNQNIHNAFASVEYYRNVGKLSFIGTGIQLVEKGFKNSYSINFPSYFSLKYFFRLDYLEIPIMYRQKFKNILKHFSVSAGILNSYLIKSAQGSNTIFNNNEHKGTSYNPDVFNKYDVGFMLRLTWEINPNILFNFSFTRGFIRPYIYNSGELNYNEVFLIGLSYKIY